MIDIIPSKVKTKGMKIIRDNKIRSLYKFGCSMDQICKLEKVSKTTVFLAINYGHRSKKEIVKKNFNKIIN